MGEEGKVVSFLKGFTDRAFAGNMLRTVQANTLGKATDVALEKEAERKKEHQVMDKEPIDVGAAKTNQESADGFLSIPKTETETHGATTGLQCISRSPAQLPAPRANKRTQAVLRTTHTDAQRTVNLNPNHWANKELTGCREQPTSQSAHAAKG